MTTDCAFDHDGDEDFTRDFTASADQDYITLFICTKGQDYDKETVGKKASSRATAELSPHNFADKAKHRTYQTDNGKMLFLSPSTLPPNASLQIRSIRLSTGLQCSSSREDQASLVLPWRMNQ
jgi:hypothetical protein